MIFLKASISRHWKKVFCIKEQWDSSHHLRFWLFVKGIDALIENNGKIQLVISPKLSETDISDIEHGYEVKNHWALSYARDNEYIFDDEFGLKNLSYLAQLIAKNVLDIKVAVLASGNRYSMYHEKMGILTDSDGNQIAFLVRWMRAIMRFMEITKPSTCFVLGQMTMTKRTCVPKEFGIQSYMGGFWTRYSNTGISGSCQIKTIGIS